MEEARWYVAHTYSGYENKVKLNIETMIKNRDMQDKILEVRVPVQEAMELKNGKQKPIQKKLYPGYVFIRMVMNDETWYLVRNTRGVTGFVGPESKLAGADAKPVPLTDEEMENLALPPAEIDIGFAEGDTVKVVNDIWKNNVGVIKSIDRTKQTVTVGLESFGDVTSVEFSLSDIRKI